MTVLLLTAFLSLWAAAAILAVSLCVVAGRSDTAEDRRRGVRLVSSR